MSSLLVAIQGALSNNASWSRLNYLKSNFDLSINNLEDSIFHSLLSFLMAEYRLNFTIENWAHFNSRKI